MAILTNNIDSRPYTGTRHVKGQLRLSTKPWLDNYFNGTPNCEQVTGVTRGKVYDILQVEGFGDCEDISFIDDNGKLQTLVDFFFEEII